jgi:hypothetical protein
MFIRPHDLHTIADPRELEDLIPSEQILERAYEQTLEDVKMHLRYLYDVDAIFVNVHVWDPAATYQEGDIISLEASEWSSSVEYSAGDLAAFDGIVYEATATNSAEEPEGSSNWKKVGTRNTIYVSGKDSNTSDPVSSDWEVKDPRHKIILRIVLDCVLYELYAGTQPRAIPEYPEDRKDRSMETLKEIRQGKVSPDLPERLPQDDQQDERIRYGTFDGGNSF